MLDIGKKLFAKIHKRKQSAHHNHGIHFMARELDEWFDHQKHEPIRIVPHPRTLRKAREQVKYMVIDGTSILRIRNYLNRWVMWWVNTSEAWLYHEILQWFVDACWDVNPATVVAGLLVHHFSNTHRDDFSARCGRISSASLMFLLGISFPKAATPPPRCTHPRHQQLPSAKYSKPNPEREE